MKKFFLFLFLWQSVIAQTGARYLIITHDDFYNKIKPFARWKTTKGLKTKIVKLSDIGNGPEQIKNYITDVYNTWDIKPQYLLLVGSPNKIPFPSINYQGYVYESDNYYTNVTGDFHNELLPGRFWVDDTLEARTIVAKVLSYEKCMTAIDSFWYRGGVTIVNEDEDSFPADSVYWADVRYAHTLMLGAGFTEIDSLAQSFGNTSVDVINAINNGCSYILYRGVGFNNWDYPFNAIHGYDMHNGPMLPVVISATCATVYGIGQEWTRTGTPTELKGVVGFLGTTTALMHAAEFRSALAKGTLENIFCDSLSTLGKAAEAGRLKYYELFHNTLEYNSWTCLGDPSMELRTFTPKGITVVHDSLFWVVPEAGTIRVHVEYNSVPVESALVCIMAERDTTIYHYGRTDNAGNITFIDTFHIPGDSLVCTVTGRNLKPYSGKAPVKFTGGPYLLLNSFLIEDSIGGNNDNIANPGEDIDIPVWIKNWGDSTAYNVVGVLQKAAADPFFTLYDTTKSFDDVPAFDSAFSSVDGYNIVVDSACPDSHRIDLSLVIKDDNDSTWISDFNFIVHAPIIEFVQYYFPGYLKYTPTGDTNQLIVELVNTGSYQAENLNCTIFTTDSFVNILDPTSSFGTILPDTISSNESDPFIITTLPETPPGHPVDMGIEIIAGVYVDTINFTIYVGQKDYLIWDPDLNHSSGPIIKSILESLNFYGDYTPNQLPLNDFLSLYKSLFVCLGVFPDNYIVKDTSRQAYEISRYLNILNGKVYMEGGDVWYGDPYYYHGYFFAPLFRISPVANGVGQLNRISGCNNTFTQSMVFDYNGEANSIDRIDAQGNGVLIFQKTGSSFGTGVCAYHRTIGLSFELGALVDSTPPSTKNALVDSIMRYFGIPPTGISEDQTFQKKISFYLTVFPNPCRKSVTISFAAETEPENASTPQIKIYDINGRVVKSFEKSKILNNPTGRITWNGRDDAGRKVAAGVYFVLLSLSTDNNTKTYKRMEKIIFLK